MPPKKKNPLEINQKNLVEKRNVLNEIRSNNMTLQELRFFSIYLSKINARDSSTRKVRFSMDDFRKIMELPNVKPWYLQAITNKLLGKIVNIPNERGGYTGFQLFRDCTVDQDEYGRWYVEIDAHDKALPLMFDFKRDYFTYELWNALRLKSLNQLRMYEILKQYEKAGQRKLTLDELRGLLGIAKDEYPRWDRFKDRVLDSCQAALAECTDICFTYTPIRSGRKIVGVLFEIRKNTNYTDQLSLDEFLDAKEGDDVIEAQYSIFCEPDDRNAIFADALPKTLSAGQVEHLRSIAIRKVPYDISTMSRNDFEFEVAQYLRGKTSLLFAQNKPVAVPAYCKWLETVITADPDVNAL